MLLELIIYCIIEKKFFNKVKEKKIKYNRNFEYMYDCYCK